MSYNKYPNFKRNNSLNLTTKDINKKTHRLYTNKINYSLKVDDINQKKVLKITSPRNPLDRATLPSSYYKNNEPIEVAKFIRDNISVKDIDGASPKKIYDKQIRDHINKDIDVNQMHHFPLKESKPFYSLLSKDITHPKQHHQVKISNRHTNPLSPQYKIASSTLNPKETIIIGDIKGSKPKKLVKKFTNRITNKISDIDGTQSNWRRSNMLKTERRSNPNTRNYQTNVSQDEEIPLISKLYEYKQRELKITSPKSIKFNILNNSLDNDYQLDQKIQLSLEQEKKRKRNKLNK